MQVYATVQHFKYQCNASLCWLLSNRWQKDTQMAAAYIKIWKKMCTEQIAASISM